MIDKKQFVAQFASAEAKRNVKIGVIASAVCAALNLINFFGVGGVALIDMLLFGLFALEMLSSGSRVCAVAAASYFSLGKIFVLVMGRFSVYQLILTAVFLYAFGKGIKGSFQMDKEYKAFCANNNVDYTVE